MNIPLHWRNQPFTGVVNTFMCMQGMTVAEMVACIPADKLPARFIVDGVVCVNGRQVPRDMWARECPRAARDIVVTLHVPLHNGGGGGGQKNTLATVAAIAVLVVATAATGGAFATGAAGLASTWFAAGSTSAALLGAGIGVAGSLAIAALSPPPQRANSTDSGFSGDGSGDSGKTPASVDGNILSRGESVPRVVGTHKIFPPLGAEPYVELIGDDEYVEALFVLAGPHAIADIQLGEVPIEQITDLEYEVTEALPDSDPITLITRQTHTDAPQIALSCPITDATTPTQLLDQITPGNSVPIWHATATRNAPDEFIIQVAFQEGITDYASPTTKMAIPIRLRFRRQGAEIWINAPEIHFTSKTGLPLQKMIRFKWGAPPLTIPLAPTDEAPYLAYKVVPGQTALSPVTVGWTANDYFSGGSGGDLYSAATFDTHNVRNIALQTDGVDIYLDTTSYPKDIYEIQLIAGGAYDSGSFTAASYTYSGLGGAAVYDLFGYFTTGGIHKPPRTRAQIHDKVLVGRVSSIWNETPLPDDDAGNQMFAAIAIRAKNRRIDKLSCIASGYVRDWDGAEWGAYATTSNPAAHMVDVLTGPLNADPLPPSLLDSAGLVSWRAACTSLGYTCDAVIQGGSVDDARLLIASCGYARPYQSETWGVIRDRDRSADTPVQIFSSRNLSSFRWEKAFPRLPDGFRVVFSNSVNDYQEDEISVLRSGITAGAADRLEEIRYVGVGTTAAVTTRAEYDLAQLDSRPTFYYGNAAAESLVCQRGDLVGVQHDVIAHWAGSARIASVTRDGSNAVTSITLDGSVPSPGAHFFEQPPTFLTPATFMVGQASGASIRRTDGSIATAQVDNGASSDDVTTLTFTAPLADASSLIAEGCLVTTGILGQEYRRLIVFDMRPGKDLTADLTFVDEAPELWS